MLERDRVLLVEPQASDPREHPEDRPPREPAELVDGRSQHARLAPEPVEEESAHVGLVIGIEEGERAEQGRKCPPRSLSASSPAALRAAASARGGTRTPTSEDTGT